MPFRNRRKKHGKVRLLDLDCAVCCNVLKPAGCAPRHARRFSFKRTLYERDDIRTENESSVSIRLALVQLPGCFRLNGYSLLRGAACCGRPIFFTAKGELGLLHRSIMHSLVGAPCAGHIIRL